MSEHGDECAAILRARARALARRQVPTLGATDSRHVIEFRLGRERYAIDSTCVRGVHPLSQITCLPGTPAFIRGITNIRGQVIPVLDLQSLFEISAAETCNAHLTIVVTHGDVMLGIAVDSVTGTQHVEDAATVAPPPSTSAQSQWLQGITADRLALIDIHALLADARIVVDESVEC